MSSKDSKPSSKVKVASVHESRIPQNPPSPYTAIEKKWLEKNKPLVRSMIEAIKAAKDETSDLEDEIIAVGAGADATDEIFSKKQLKWVKDVYGTSENFMKMNFDPTKRRDCVHARSTVDSTLASLADFADNFRRQLGIDDDEGGEEDENDSDDMD